MVKNLQAKNSKSKSRNIFTADPSGTMGTSVRVSNPIPVVNLISKGVIS
jgi:hypothetical protein